MNDEEFDVSIQLFHISMLWMFTPSLCKENVLKHKSVQGFGKLLLLQNGGQVWWDARFGKVW